jgi:2-polyprenyl-6-methoxyphenol hydroxylase-like FAD-dependent oxidoreductase
MEREKPKKQMPTPMRLALPVESASPPPRTGDDVGAGPERACEPKDVRAAQRVDAVDATGRPEGRGPVVGVIRAAQRPGVGDTSRSLPEDATVRGVHYRTRGGRHDLRAPLTIGADGRFSRLRRLAGFELESNAPPMDVIWFRLPRRPGDPEEAHGKIGKGHLMVILNRGDEWQIAYVIAKGAYKEIHDAGLPAFRRAIAEMAPEFADRVDAIQDWHQTSLLAVEAGRVKRWYRPGLLLIGDAAHVMSPVGGVGINYAIQDAVVASNVLRDPLTKGRLKLSDLAAVQRQREIPTRIIQRFQRVVQERMVTRALSSDAPIQPPPIMHLPVLRDVIPRMLALGVWPVRPKP